MTTPERLRRRQRMEGAILVIVAVLMVAQAFYFNLQDKAQRDCLQRNLRDFSTALRVRADLSEDDSQAKTNVIMAVARASGDAGKTQTALDAFIIDQASIDQKRRETPVPPIPSGECE